MTPPRRWLLIARVVALVALGLPGCTSPTNPTPPPESPTSGSATSESPTSGSPTSEAPTSGSGEEICAYPSSGEAAKPVKPPTTSGFPTTGQVTVTMHMDAGDVVMTLDRDNAPCAVHSLESLVTQGYFDDTICHRLAPNFVLQCGDPTATGRGGPGYRFADELTGQENYRYATVAMANAGPDTNGSQFFIVIASDAHLPPSYTVLGTVDANSMKVVDAIAAQGIDPNDPNASVQGGLPSEGGHIASMTVS